MEGRADPPINLNTAERDASCRISRPTFFFFNLFVWIQTKSKRYFPSFLTHTSSFAPQGLIWGGGNWFQFRNSLLCPASDFSLSDFSSSMKAQGTMLPFSQITLLKWQFRTTALSRYLTRSGCHLHSDEARCLNTPNKETRQTFVFSLSGINLHVSF